MKRNFPVRTLCLAALAFAMVSPACAQSVAVTATLDTNRVAVGGTTTLRVWARVVPARQAEADRIFAWHLDLENLAPAVAGLLATPIERPASDGDPFFSGSGVVVGAHLRGVFDTFLQRPGAGVSNRVELFNLPVRGVSPGTARFQVRPGSGASGLATDFLVAPKVPGDPWSGGDYAEAVVALEVVGTLGPVVLSIATEPLDATRRRVILSFQPTGGGQPVVESTDALSGSVGWRALAGAPHVGGRALDTNTVPQRYYRVRVQ